MNLRASSLGGGGGEKREQERESKNAGFGKSDYTALMKISEKLHKMFQSYEVLSLLRCV